MLQLLVQLIYYSVALLQLPMQVIDSGTGSKTRSSLLAQFGLKAVDLRIQVSRGGRGEGRSSALLRGAN